MPHHLCSSISTPQYLPLFLSSVSPSLCLYLSSAGKFRTNFKSPTELKMKDAICSVPSLSILSLLPLPSLSPPSPLPLSLCQPPTYIQSSECEQPDTIEYIYVERSCPLISNGCHGCDFVFDNHAPIVDHCRIRVFTRWMCIGSCCCC